MNRLTMLRATAVVMAVVGTVDPSITRTQHLPAPIEIRHSTSALASNELRSAAGDVQERLKKALGREVAFNSDAAPAARVTIGGKPTARDEAADVPQSTIRLDDRSGPGVRILAVNDPAPVPVGWVTGITASIEARGLAGATSTFVLEERGAEIARVERAWSSHLERTTVTLPYFQPGRACRECRCGCGRRLPGRASATTMSTSRLPRRAVVCEFSSTSRGLRGAWPSSAACSKRIRRSTSRPSCACRVGLPFARAPHRSASCRGPWTTTTPSSWVRPRI